jgi:sugar lactone lactonase YvrE
MHIRPNGKQALLGRRDNLVPNGIAAMQDGTFLVANVGAEGGIWQVSGDGVFAKLDIRPEGRPLPEVNFIHIDEQRRLWICVSSRGAADPLFTPRANEGSILLADRRGVRTVAAGLGWTNELRVSSDGRHLFVNETFGRRLLQFRIADDGSLQDKTVLAQFGAGDYPDGMALDDDGGIWVVSIISNRVYRVDQASCRLMFSDGNPRLIDELEALLQERGLRRSDLHGLRTGSAVNNISSIAFGGPDGRTAYLGSLNGDCLWSFRAPVRGIPLPPRQPSFPLRVDPSGEMGA